MMPIELEIVTIGGRRATEVVEVPRSVTMGGVIILARELCRSCGWHKVRVGIGNLWSKWIY